MEEAKKEIEFRKLILLVKKQLIVYNKVNLSKYIYSLIKIIQNKDSIIKTITIQNCNLQDNDFKAIFDAVTFNTNIYKVNLSFHDITYIGLKYACDFIKTNINIIKFYLFDCKIDVFGSKILSKGLSSNSSIKILLIQNNMINDQGVKYICESLKLNKYYCLSELNSEHNNITSIGAKYISQFLVINNSVEKLILTNNKIDISGAILINKALRHNNKAYYTCLCKNKIKYNHCCYSRIYNRCQFDSSWYLYEYEGRKYIVKRN